MDYWRKQLDIAANAEERATAYFWLANGNTAEMKEYINAGLDIAPINSQIRYELEAVSLRLNNQYLSKLLRMVIDGDDKITGYIIYEIYKHCLIFLERHIPEMITLAAKKDYIMANVSRIRHDIYKQSDNLVYCIRTQYTKYPLDEEICNDMYKYVSSNPYDTNIPFYLAYINKSSCVTNLKKAAANKDLRAYAALAQYENKGPHNGDHYSVMAAEHKHVPALLMLIEGSLLRDEEKLQYIDELVELGCCRSVLPLREIKRGTDLIEYYRKSIEGGYYSAAEIMYTHTSSDMSNHEHKIHLYCGAICYMRRTRLVIKADVISFVIKEFGFESVGENAVLDFYRSLIIAQSFRDYMNTTHEQHVGSSSTAGCCTIL